MALSLGSLLVTVISSAVLLFLGAWLLQQSVKLLKGSDTSWKTAWGVNLIVVVIGFVLGLLGSFGVAIPLAGFLGLIVGIWLVKTRYNYDWKNCMITWLVWAVVSIVASLLLGMILSPLLL